MKPATHNNTDLLPLVAAIVLSFIAPAPAAVIVLYNFTGSSYAPSSTDPNATASTISAGAGPFSVSINTIVGNPAPSLEFGVTGIDSSAAFNANNYFTFTITPVASGTLSLTNITLDLAHSWNNAVAQGFDIYTSVGGFASTAAIVGSGSRSVAGANVFQNLSVDLSGASFQNLTSAITFRIYFYDGASVGTSHQLLDNLTINGTAVVPEPTSLALIASALAGGTLFLRRRRQRWCRYPKSSLACATFQTLIPQ